MKPLFTAAICLAFAVAFPLATLSPAHAAENTQDQSVQPGTDTWITTKVKAELMATKGISSTDISVTTTNGTVTLSGVVDAKVQVDKAIAVARAVKGVKDVDASALKSRE